MAYREREREEATNYHQKNARLSFFCFSLCLSLAMGSDHRRTRPWHLNTKSQRNKSLSSTKHEQALSGGRVRWTCVFNTFLFLVFPSRKPVLPDARLTQCPGQHSIIILTLYIIRYAYGIPYYLASSRRRWRRNESSLNFSLLFLLHFLYISFFFSFFSHSSSHFSSLVLPYY